MQINFGTQIFIFSSLSSIAISVIPLYNSGFQARSINNIINLNILLGSTHQSVVNRLILIYPFFVLTSVIPINY